MLFIQNHLYNEMLCSYLGAIFKHVWFFSVGVMLSISIRFELIIKMEVDIMIIAILWICLVAGKTLMGRLVTFPKIRGVGIHR